MVEKKMMGEKVEEEGEREGEDDVIGKDEMVRKEEKEVLEMDEGASREWGIGEWQGG